MNTDYTSVYFLGSLNTPIQKWGRKQFFYYNIRDKRDYHLNAQNTKYPHPRSSYPVSHTLSQICQ